MLTRLTVNNYALIGSAEIEFPAGLIIITGETGAGKSILLGALSLILGQRADTSVLLGKDKKCFVEGEFSLEGTDAENFFLKHDLEVSENAMLRREIGADGRSRAFINDTPVTLSQLKEFGAMLVDIHSQHETLSINRPAFQLGVVDALAGNQQVLPRYEGLFNQYTFKRNKLAELRDTEQKSNSEMDYFLFLFDELEKAGLKEGEQEELEQQLETLKHSEQIISNLDAATQVLSGSEDNITSKLSSLNSALKSTESFFPALAEPAERLRSAWIELKDIANELDKLQQHVNADPKQLELVTLRLESIYHLQSKHRLKTIAELLNLKEELNKKIENVQSLGEEIKELEGETTSIRNTLMNMALTLSENRKKMIPKAEKEMLRLLGNVGMPGASFRIEMKESEELHSKGKDSVLFLFSANKGIQAQELSRVASGGELSRLVLCIKSLVAKKIALPTMVFDEIDTGVSGEMAFRVGEMMERIAQGHQVISITHLPQIASKGSCHLLVYKFLSGSRTSTGIRILSPEERVVEVAKMIGGDNPSSTVLENAKELLGN